MRLIRHIVQWFKPVGSHPFLNVDRHAAVRVTRFRIGTACDPGYPGPLIGMQVIGSDVTNYMVFREDLRMIVG